MSVNTNERLMRVLLAPHASEKTARIEEESGQVTFKVARFANKNEIKAAVELMFGVKVTDVRVLNQNGKRKTFGRNVGAKQDWKKAYVTLADGENIQDFMGEV